VIQAAMYERKLHRHMLAAIDLLLEVGATLPVCTFTLGDLCYIDKLLPRASGRFMEMLKEYALQVFSNEQNMRVRVGLMIEIHCFNVIELQDVWRQTRSPTDNPSKTILDEILCCGGSLSATDWFSLLQKSLTTIFGNDRPYSAVNEILSSLVAHSPSLARSFGQSFYWYNTDYAWWHRGNPLQKANKQTLEIMKCCGANPSYIKYRLMDLSTKITYWQHYIEEGVDTLALSWVLLNSIVRRLSAEHLIFLISNGADVNYSMRLYNGDIETPLVLATTWCGNEYLEMVVRLLLCHGADILLHINDPKDINGSERISQRASYTASRQLVEMLEELEKEEISRRNIHIVPSAGELND
jgi:hypothetical protein